VVAIRAGPGFGVGGAPIRAVAVFANKDASLHKYSAILAASEPFLTQRNSEIRSILTPLVFWYYKFSGTSFNDPTSKIRQMNERVDAVCQQYEKRTGEIVRSYGLPISTFNTMSGDIDMKPQLKKRVLLQAYFYKIAADLESNIRPVLPTLPDVHATQRGSYNSYMMEDAYAGSGNDGSTRRRSRDPELTRFVKALRAVEIERLRLRTELQRELNVDYLPSTMCDPQTLPAMAKNIQRACVNFPQQALAVVGDYDIDAGRFEDLKTRMKRNLIFKAQVSQENSRVRREQVREERMAAQAAAHAVE
jgi:hypothetical protein